ncbi:MAG TPA: deoxyribonuclease IV [bacterium]|nr:deoxyribonuclease IV [bacterium]
MGLLGAHISTAGGLDQAFDRGERLGCEAIQIFTRNQRRWNPPPLSEKAVAAFRLRYEKSPVRSVVSHGSYLLNLASPDRDRRTKSFSTLLDEIDRAGRLGISCFVCHPGSHRGAGESAGLDSLAETLNRALSERPDSPVRLLLENTAGSGHHLGAQFEQFRYVIDRIEDPSRIGICFDTAHAFAAGAALSTPGEIRDTFGALDAVVGLERIRVFHLNDSKAGSGTRVDRHENIGKGRLGTEIFSFLLHSEVFKDRPMLLETPGGEEGYREDLAALRSLIHGGGGRSRS